MSGNRFRDWYRSKPGRPLILAHRGDSFFAPENTLEAARLGLDSGADGWEFDVRATRDGVPIVFHDESLARTTDVALRFEGDPRSSAGFLVADFLLEEIRSLDAGSWFVDPEGGARSAAGFGTLGRLSGFDRALFASRSIRVPTLDEALGLTARLDLLANVEIKPGAADPSSLVDSVLRALREFGCLGLATVSSFDPEIVQMVAAREASVATGALVEAMPVGETAALLRSLGADALHAPASAEGLETAGAPVLIYTVNDAGLAWRLAEAGVVGLFTDDPSSMASWFSVSPSARRTRPR